MKQIIKFIIGWLIFTVAMYPIFEWALRMWAFEIKYCM